MKAFAKDVHKGKMQRRHFPAVKVRLKEYWKYYTQMYVDPLILAN